MGEAEQQPELHDVPVRPHVSGGGTLDAMPEEEPAEPNRVGPGPYGGSRLLSVLFDTRGPVWKYIIRAGLISLVPSVLVSFLLALVGMNNEGTMPQFDQRIGPVAVFVGLVIISPLLETLALGFGLWLLSFGARRPLRQALGSCVLWGVLHSLLAPAWGFVVAWPFFVFSCAYLAWRPRSWWHAVGVTCGIHMFQNLLPGILIAVT